MFWIILLALLCGAVAVVALVWKALSASGVDDPTGMVGQEGIAQETFTQAGIVFARGELWKATSDGGIIQKGDTVRVQAVRSGLVLLVSGVKKLEGTRD